MLREILLAGTRPLIVVTDLARYDSFIFNGTVVPESGKPAPTPLTSLTLRDCSQAAVCEEKSCGPGTNLLDR